MGHVAYTGVFAITARDYLRQYEPEVLQLIECSGEDFQDDNQKAEEIASTLGRKTWRNGEGDIEASEDVWSLVYR